MSKALLQKFDGLIIFNGVQAKDGHVAEDSVR
jgi:hypothetical protein